METATHCRVCEDGHGRLSLPDVKKIGIPVRNQTPALLLAVFSGVSRLIRPEPVPAGTLHLMAASRFGPAFHPSACLGAGIFHHPAYSFSHFPSFLAALKRAACNKIRGCENLGVCQLV